MNGRLWCVAVLAGCVGLGCGSDAADSPRSATGGSAPGSGGSGGATNAGAGGKAGAGGAPSSGGSAGNAGASGSGGAAAGSGGQILSDAGISDAGPPDPTDAGLAAYTLECRGSSVDCGDPLRVRCLSVGTSDAAVGFACSNRCETAADCSDAPSGAEAEISCVQLTAARHCLFVCRDEVRGDFACPSGMSCYVYPGSPIGYCLWQ